MMEKDAEIAPDTEGEFRAAVLSGLASQPRRIPCKFLYDRRGSELFERICQLPEYYLTRTELALLEKHGAEMAALCGQGGRLVEFGSGSTRKVRVLLDALRPRQYVPVDVSSEFLQSEVSALQADHPDLRIHPVHADFTQPFDLPDAPADATPTVGFFPGSTVGNFSPGEAIRWLGQAGRVVGAEGTMLVGVDTKKEERLLHAAYNDPQGVTAAFTLNLLRRINRELAGDFDLDAFDHHAHFDAREGCVRIHIVSRRRQEARVCGRTFRFAKGDCIHVEDSYKYSVEEFHWLGRAAGFEPMRTWTDPAGMFSIHCLKPSRSAAAE